MTKSTWKTVSCTLQERSCLLENPMCWGIGAAMFLQVEYKYLTSRESNHSGSTFRDLSGISSLHHSKTLNTTRIYLPTPCASIFQELVYNLYLTPIILILQRSKHSIKQIHKLKIAGFLFFISIKIVYKQHNKNKHTRDFISKDSHMFCTPFSFHFQTRSSGQRLTVFTSVEKSTW